MTQSLKSFFYPLAFCSFLFLVGLLFVYPSNASAVTGSDFRSGNIIDDGVFFNPYGMSVEQIQQFLNSKVPVCDTSGSQPYGGTTRAAYGASRGYPAPYICLKDYSQMTVSKSAEAGLCNGYGQSTQSAAQIIYNVAQSCGINAKVLIVLLQKEQSLITDDWPWSIQYRSATGYGCPDTAPCDAEYYGFFNQVYSAARQFKRYAKDSNLFNYRPYRENYIQYNPNASCGGSNVYIHNYATAGLYNYTPYQPNASALANLYGTGDSCGAYGNRNFWRMYNDWFNINETIINGLSVSINTQPDPTPFRGQTVTYSYTLTNRLSIALTLDAVGAVGRAGSLTGSNRDLGWQDSITIQPGQSQQFTFTSKIKDTGLIYVWPAVSYNSTYVQYNNWGATLNSRQPSISFASPLSASINNPIAGQDITFSATLRNNEQEPLNYDGLGIPVRFYNRYNYDSVWVGPGTVAAGSEVVLIGVRNIDKPGPFSYWVSNYFGGEFSTIGTVKNFNSSEAIPNFSVSGLTFNSTNPVVGQNITASFTVTNNLPVSVDVDGVGVVGRFATLNGSNKDIGWQGPVHFNAGETKTFTGYSRAVTDLGIHYYWVGILNNGGYLQYNNWGSTVVSRNPNFSVSGLTFNSTNPVVGQNITASFTVTNNLPVSVDVDGVGVVGRFATLNGSNKDIGWQGPVHFNAGETKTFTGYSRAVTDLGIHYYWVGILNNGGYLQYNNWGSTVVSRN